jgi:hypothetical protein
MRKPLGGAALPLVPLGMRLGSTEKRLVGQEEPLGQRALRLFVTDQPLGTN